MIVVDTSALIAIILHEDEREHFLDIFDAADAIIISAASIIEARMVTYGRGGAPLVRIFDTFLADYRIEIVAVGAVETEAAHIAFTTYGKGSGHPAQLNFGDLFSYALAKTRGLPLLFKGDDFAQTDIKVATLLQ